MRPLLTYRKTELDEPVSSVDEALRRERDRQDGSKGA